MPWKALLYEALPEWHETSYDILLTKLWAGIALLYGVLDVSGFGVHLSAIHILLCETSHNVLV